MQRLNLMLLLIASLTLTSCSLDVPNIEICLDKGNKARCTTTITKKVRIPTEWNSERVGRLSVSPNGWKKIKKFILKACQLTECNVEQLKEELERTIN